MSVQEIKVFKSTFYKNKSSEGGAQNVAIKKKPIGSILIASDTQKHGRMWGYSSKDIFLKNLEKNHGLYEVLHNFPLKVYFDIDESCAVEDFDHFINYVKNIILEIFPNADLAISGSMTDEKTSLHIVVNNYYIKNENDRTYMKHLTKYMSENKLSSIDWKVYTKNRQMKCINQSKRDGRVQEIIENNDFKKHVITDFFTDDIIYPLPELIEPIKHNIDIEKSKKTFDLGMLPKLNLICPDHIDFENMTEEECLLLLPLDKSFNHDYTHIVARFVFYSKTLAFVNFISWYKNKSDKTENLKKWERHWSKLDDFPPVSLHRMKNIMATFYPHIKKDIHYRKFLKSFTLPENIIKKIVNINQASFEIDIKFLLFNLGMGAGKTYQTIEYLKTQDNFIWIAPNKALAENTYNRMKDIENLTHYLNVSTENKRQGKLNQCNRLISVLNSLHYLTTKTYDVIVIDEIETLIDKFYGDFMNQGRKMYKKKIWQIFVNLLSKAKKVILLDAFITNKTLNLIKNINKECYKGEYDLVNNTIIYQRQYEPQTRIVKFKKDFTMTLNEIVKKIKDGSKLFIFYPYKDGYGEGENKRYSMEALCKYIEQQTNRQGEFYNADIDDIKKKDLGDVNNKWFDKWFVITNNILTCGVSYEEKDFDEKYLFVGSHNEPRDIIQVSYRARHLNSSVINICHMGKMTKPSAYEDDCQQIGCPIYKKMYDDILTEKKSPSKRTLQLFCSKAHYKNETSKDIEDFIDKSIQKEITEDLDKYDFGYTYDNINDIDSTDAEKYNLKCFRQEATRYEKMMLKKYYFKREFMMGADEKIVEELWNDNFFFFIKSIQNMKIEGKDNIFYKIAEFNQQKPFKYDDVKKIKLNDEILDQIFTNFKFTTINRTTSIKSSIPHILKTIFKIKYGKNIIETIYPKSEENNKKHTKYIMDDIYQEMYDFCDNYLVLQTDIDDNVCLLNEM